jgi:hypothetical protein
MRCRLKRGWWSAAMHEREVFNGDIRAIAAVDRAFTESGREYPAAGAPMPRRTCCRAACSTRPRRARRLSVLVADPGALRLAPAKTREERRARLAERLAAGAP